MLNLYLRFRRPLTIACMLLGILSVVWVLMGSSFSAHAVPTPQLLFVACSCVGVLGFLISLLHDRGGFGPLLLAHLISMIGFGTSIGLAAGSRGAIPVAMAALNGALAIVVLLVRIEQDDRKKSSKL